MMMLSILGYAILTGITAFANTFFQLAALRFIRYFRFFLSLFFSIAKPIVETSVKVRQNLEKFVWSSREK
jgi:hypothetical protein